MTVPQPKPSVRRMLDFQVQMMSSSLDALPAGDVLPKRARAARQPIITWAETAPCTCPDYCERDHEFD
jgi:hypothetical protein